MLIIAHRGGTDFFPEQTIDSAIYSLSNGADYVELDLRYTKDPYTPVICHDDNASRIFGIDRRIEDFTLDEFLNLRYKTNNGYRPYTLSELLSIHTVSRILFHIKTDAVKLDPILDLISEFKAEKKVVLGIDSVAAVEKIKTYNSKIQVLAFMKYFSDFSDFVNSDCDIIRLWESWVTDKAIDDIHAAGKKVWIMSGTPETVGYTDLDNLKLWEGKGVEGVLINEIMKAKQMMRL